MKRILLLSAFAAMAGAVWTVRLVSGGSSATPAQSAAAPADAGIPQTADLKAVPGSATPGVASGTTPSQKAGSKSPPLAAQFPVGNPPPTTRLLSPAGSSTRNPVTSGTRVSQQPAPASPLTGESSEVVEIAAHSPLVQNLGRQFVASLPEVEQAALGTAKELFEKTLSEYGPLDKASEDYFYAYQESAQASDDFLRAYLGWDRFMALSSEGIKQAREELASARQGSQAP